MKKAPDNQGLSLIRLPAGAGRYQLADVVDYAVDAAHFIKDAVGHLAQERMRQMRPMRRHEVLRLHDA
jgi:hypothetical protein